MGLRKDSRRECARAEFYCIGREDGARYEVLGLQRDRGTGEARHTVLTEIEGQYDTNQPLREREWGFSKSV